MNTSTTPTDTVHPPSTPPPMTANPPATLDQALDLMDAMMHRLIRMETRLIRLMNANGLDANGDPFDSH